MAGLRNKGIRWASRTFDFDEMIWKDGVLGTEKNQSMRVAKEKSYGSVQLASVLVNSALKGDASE